MGRDTIQLEDAVSTISQEYLQEFASEYYIPKSLHPELPGPEDNIVDFPEGAAKVSHFEINCRVLNIRPTVNLFRVFYIPSYNSGWMSFSKRQEKNTSQCYLKPLGSLKNWNNRFFWVDERVFPTVVDWRTSALKDERPAVDSYSAVDVATLNLHRTPIQKQPEELLNGLVQLNQCPKSPQREETETQVPAAVAPEVPRAENPATTKVVPELNLEKEVAAIGAPLNKRRRKRDKGEAKANAPPKVLKKDHASVRPQPSTPAALQSVSEQDPLSYAQPQPLPEQDIAQ
ncbi:hypothetical protein Tco_0116055 [Tanacetum coccineum]